MTVLLGSKCASHTLRLAGAGLLAACASIHLDLYLTGYRFIPTIGPLFILQVVVGYALALGIVLTAHRLLALVAALFALSTLGGYILSLWVGLFGFHEVRTEAGVVAGVIEVLAFATLSAWAAWVAPNGAPTRSSAATGWTAERLWRLGRPSLLPAMGLALLALVLATALAPSSSPSRALSSRASSVARASSVVVVIKNFAFSPSRLTVGPGTRLVVKNEDGVAHTFTAMPNSRPQGHFDTGDIDPGDSATITAPTAPGRYQFYCAIHPFMTGVITVAD